MKCGKERDTHTRHTHTHTHTHKKQEQQQIHWSQLFSRRKHLCVPQAFTSNCSSSTRTQFNSALVLRHLLRTHAPTSCRLSLSLSLSLSLLASRNIEERAASTRRASHLSLSPSLACCVFLQSSARGRLIFLM